MASVELRNLTKIFRGPGREEVVAVNDLSLTVADKEFIVFVGPSGCGKTTTLRLIAGLEDVSAGRISIGSIVMTEIPPQGRDVAMVFQNHALYPHMTVFQNVAFGLKLRKVPKAEIEQRVKAAGESLGLTRHLERFPKELSGGERQRVALARAIVRRPKVFLFDEPLSNLDATLRVQLRAEISRLHRQLEATMIYVTHDQIEAMTLGQRIAVLNNGVLQQLADPLKLYRDPANMFVAGFIGSPPMNLFRGRVVKAPRGLIFQEHNPSGVANGSRMELPLPGERGERLAAFAEGNIVLGLRPENIHCDGDSPNAAQVKSRVDLVEPLGAETRIHLSTGAHLFIAKTVGRHPTIGDLLPLRFDMSKAFFFHPVSEARIG